jgi:hypothetical protein
LTGWNKTEIQIKDLSSEDQYKIKKDCLEIQFPTDGILHIPHDLAVTIKAVNGDAVIKEVGSDIKISAVNGDLRVRDIGSAVIETVTGDMIAKRVQGDLNVKTINGDALIDDIKGQVGLKTVKGDLLIEKIGGGLEAKAEGDGTLDFSPVPWQAYRVDVEGNLSFSLPEDCNADLSIKSKKGDISIFLGDLDIKSSKTELNQQLGEGGTAILLSAGGSVFLSGDDFDLMTGFKLNLDDFKDFSADFAAQTSDQIKENLVDLEFDLRASMADLEKSLEEMGISEENLKEVGIRIEESSRLAAEKAELAAIKAQAKVEKKIAQARRKALKAQAKVKEFDLGDFLEETREKKAVKDTERLLILEMLQEKKITPEEAEDLLKALEGKS